MSNCNLLDHEILIFILFCFPVDRDYSVLENRTQNTNIFFLKHKPKILSRGLFSYDNRSQHLGMRFSAWGSASPCQWNVLKGPSYSPTPLVHRHSQTQGQPHTIWLWVYIACNWEKIKDLPPLTLGLELTIFK